MGKKVEETEPKVVKNQDEKVQIWVKKEKLAYEKEDLMKKMGA